MIIRMQKSLTHFEILCRYWHQWKISDPAVSVCVLCVYFKAENIESVMIVVPGICLFMLLSSFSLMPSWPSLGSSSYLDTLRRLSARTRQREKVVKTNHNQVVLCILLLSDSLKGYALVVLVPVILLCKNVVAMLASLAGMAFVNLIFTRPAHIHTQSLSK